MDETKLHPRAVLTKEKAMEIFAYKQKLGNQSLTAMSIELADQYNVNSKTIRDIWSGRSWLEATSSQWQQATKIKQFHFPYAQVFILFDLIKLNIT